jgi:hypothetical protein
MKNELEERATITPFFFATDEKTAPSKAKKIHIPCPFRLSEHGKTGFISAGVFSVLHAES